MPFRDLPKSVKVVDRMLVVFMVLCTPAMATQWDRSAVVKLVFERSQPDLWKPWYTVSGGEGIASGIRLDANTVLTAAHVVVQAKQLKCEAAGVPERIPVKVERISMDCDLALLRLEKPIRPELEPATFAALPKVGDTVAVLGYPLMGELAITEGRVARFDLGEYTPRSEALRMQLDVSVASGNSGGPVLLRDGSIAGIALAASSEPRMAFAAPAEVIEHFLTDHRDGSYAGFPGRFVYCSTAENSAVRTYLQIPENEGGTIIQDILVPWLETALKPMDFLQKVDSQTVDSMGRVTLSNGEHIGWEYLLHKKQSGEDVSMQVLREGKVLTVSAKIGSGPNYLVKDVRGAPPRYFIYGGIVFAPASTDILAALTDRWRTFLISLNAGLATAGGRLAATPDEELVIVTSVLPNRLLDGYTVAHMASIERVNGIRVNSLRQMVAQIHSSKDKFIVFEFDRLGRERVILDREEVNQATPGILRENNIAEPCSADLLELCR